jgi:hypothetical protein
MNRVFGKKKAPGPPPPSLGDASSGVGNQIEGMDGELHKLSIASLHVSIALSQKLVAKRETA